MPLQITVMKKLKTAFMSSYKLSWIEEIPRHDMKIVMGDMNAKVRRDNTDYERAMGREGCGAINENGERLVELCTTKDLVVGGTIFPHTRHSQADLVLSQ